MITGTRVLELLSLLQTRRHWSGEELSRRLGVSARTLRRDVEGLRNLGYPITTTRGTGGGYQLSPGAALPPLMLTEDEAAAVVMGLKEIASESHATSGEAAVSAMAKIVQVLPVRLRRRIDSLRNVDIPRATSQPGRIADVVALTTVALACRDNEALKFAYRARDGQESVRNVHPHRTVSVNRRLYLIAWDLDRTGWRTFRLDRIREPARDGKKFVPRNLPDPDPVEYVRRQISSLPTKYVVEAIVEAPGEHVREVVAEYGTVDPISETSCMVHIPADSLDWAAFCLVATGAPFVVHGPVEARTYMRGWGERFIAATED